MNKLSALAILLALAAPVSLAQAKDSKPAETTKAVDVKAHHHADSAKHGTHHGKKHPKKEANMAAPTETNSEMKSDTTTTEEAK